MASQSISCTEEVLCKGLLCDVEFYQWKINALTKRDGRYPFNDVAISSYLVNSSHKGKNSGS